MQSRLKRMASCRTLEIALIGTHLFVVKGIVRDRKRGTFTCFRLYIGPRHGPILVQTSRFMQGS